MADEETAGEVSNAEESSGGEQQTPATRSSFPMGWVIVVVLGLAVMVVTPLASYLVVSRMMDSPAEEKLAPVERQDSQSTFEIGEIRVNIYGTRATRYLTVRPHLRLSEPGLEEKLEEVKPMLVDRVSTVVSRRTLDELEGPEGRRGLRRDIMAEVNSAIKDRMQGVVVDVYLVDFLIQ